METMEQSVDVRKLRQECAELPVMQDKIREFQKMWRFRRKLSDYLPIDVNQEFKAMNTVVKRIENNSTKNKMQYYLRTLVQLKLNSIRGIDSKKLASSIVNDEVFGFQEAIFEAKECNKHVSSLVKKSVYLEDILRPHLTLEQQMSLVNPVIGHLQLTKSRQNRLLKKVIGAVVYEIKARPNLQ